MGDLERYQAKRDFESSPEPSGEGASDAGAGARRFVIQKHAARRTHFDLRLEVGGTLKSWAVPKGPSADPETKRLAVEVEDHPIDYGDFEGVIPKGEYGAGAVIIWDRGRYLPYGIEDTDEAIERGLRDGKLDFELLGERLRGRWGLVRMKGQEGEKNWLLLKKKDAYADPGNAEGLVEQHLDSVVSGLGLDDTAMLEEAAAESDERARPPVDMRPMLARTAETLPAGEAWCFELKVDGIRAIAWANPSGAVRIDSRRGQRLESAFPEMAEAMELLARRSGSEFVVDGEIVASTADTAPAFEDLQPRFNLREPREIAHWARVRPAEIYVFDLLWLNGEDLRDQPLSERKEKLRPLLRAAGQRIHYTPHDVGTASAVLERARREGWEGVIAKRLKSRYRSGERGQDWLKYKERAQQEFLVCGWTDPHGSRSAFGALVLGYREQPGEEGRILAAGRVGSGFSDADLQEVAARLEPLAQDESPFAEVPEDLSDSHWVRPELIAQVKFQNWTKDNRLRQPVFVGLRTDSNPLTVVREPTSGDEPKGPAVELTPEMTTLINTLETLEKESGEGDLMIGGVRLRVTNLQKVLFPDSGVTKGELLRYYLSVAPAILPTVDGRPLTMERYPDGITGEMFYQQRAPEPLPDGIRTETIEVDDERVDRLIGGDLATLLYVVQLAAISQHIWPSRLGSLDDLDYSILDLDPAEGVPFSAVREAAQATHEQLERLGLRAYPKTSGATGIHIVIPLQPGTSYETGRLLAELLARLVASAQPDLTTVQRVISKRGKRVYLDFLQNRRGLTVASAYSVRPRPGATVSAPLRWGELDQEITPENFTVRSMRERIGEVGDLWVACRSDVNDVREILELL
jgi:bifunctional non-homologous end joining protein LigD